MNKIDEELVNVGRNKTMNSLGVVMRKLDNWLDNNMWLPNLISILAIIISMITLVVK